MLPYRSSADNKNRTMGMAIRGAVTELEAVLDQRIRRACNGFDISW